nr:hypothetical protein [Candidatus Krumholzibacteria bacterium]
MKLSSHWSAFIVLGTLAFTLSLAGPAQAEWSHDPTVNTNLTTTDNHFGSSWMQTVPGNTGEVISMWENWDDRQVIVAQKLDADGVPLWGNGGAVVIADSMFTGHPCIAPDGSGGMFLVWSKPAPTGTLARIQHFDQNGDPTWVTGGVVMQQFALVGTVQSEPQVVSDGQGGAIVAWIHDGDNNDSVYVQRFNAAGTRQWSSGTLASFTTGDARALGLHTGTLVGEACLAWAQQGGDTGWDLFGQYVLPDGSTQWTTEEETVICNSPGDQFSPQVVSFDYKGLLASWVGYGDGETPQVYVQFKHRYGILMYGASGQNAVGYYASQGDPHLCAGPDRDAYLIYTDGPGWNEQGGRVAVNRFERDWSFVWGYQGLTLSEQERCLYKS